MSAPTKHSDEVIERTKALWINCMSPEMIAETLTAEFNRTFTRGVVQGIAQRNDFPPANRTLRGDGGSETEAAIRSRSARHLEGLQAKCPLFDSVENAQ